MTPQLDGNLRITQLLLQLIDEHHDEQQRYEADKNQLQHQ
jgi:hypothetical protein